MIVFFFVDDISVHYDKKYTDKVDAFQANSLKLTKWHPNPRARGA